MALNSISPGDYMVSVDLKDAYFSVPIFQPHRRFLRFLWSSRRFEFTCLPFWAQCCSQGVHQNVQACYGTSFVVNLLHLKELYLEHCIHIDDVVATNVLNRGAHLQALGILSLRMCEQFDSGELIAIALSHPSLRIYKIDGCCNLDVLSAVSILNCPRLSLSEFSMTPDLDHTIEEWNYLENMFGELRLC